MGRLKLLLTAAAAMTALSPSSAQESTTSGPLAVVVEPAIDLGELAKGEQVSAEFEIRNDGDEPLEILRAVSDCECTIADYDQTILPGRTGALRVELSTWKLSGPGVTTIKVLTNDPDHETIQLRLGADVKDFLKARPGFARWDTVQGEEEGTIAQEIWAVDGAAFEIVGVDSPAPHLRAELSAPSKEPAAEASGNTGEDAGETAPEQAASEAPEAVQPKSGSRWHLDLTLDSQAPVGAVTGNVVVRTTHPRQKRLFIPVSGFVRPVLHVTPDYGNFGTIRTDRPKRSTYFLQVFSTEPIHVTGADTGIEGLGAEVETLEAGRRYNIVLTFGPGMAEGAFEGNLAIRTDSPKRPVVTIPLSGRVVHVSAGEGAADAVP